MADPAPAAAASPPTAAAATPNNSVAPPGAVSPDGLQPPVDDPWRPGFAKLIGRKKAWTFTIRKLSVVLGRRSKNHGDVDCSLG